MSGFLPTKVTEVDWDGFNLAKSGRTVKLLYKKEPVQFCTTSLYTPFGVKWMSKEWSSFDDYWIDCSMNRNSEEFKTFMEKLDETIKTLVKDNSHLFQNLTDDFAYSSVLRENGAYPKLMKLGLPRDKNGNFTCFLFDENKKKIKLDEGNIEGLLKKGKIFKCIIECTKVWSYNGQVGSIWNVVQLKFSPPKPDERDEDGPVDKFSQQTPSVAYDKLLIID